MRQNTLVFDRDSGIRVQTLFDLIDGARRKIELSILMHGVIEISPDESMKTLDEDKRSSHLNSFGLPRR